MTPDQLMKLPIIGIQGKAQTTVNQPKPEILLAHWPRILLIPSTQRGSPAAAPGMYALMQVVPQLYQDGKFGPHSSPNRYGTHDKILQHLAPIGPAQQIELSNAQVKSQAVVSISLGKGGLFRVVSLR